MWSAANLQTGPSTKDKYHLQCMVPTCTCILAQSHNGHQSNPAQHSLIVPDNTCNSNVIQPPSLAPWRKYWLNINQLQKPHNFHNHRLRRIKIKRSASEKKEKKKRSFIPVTGRNSTTVKNQLKVDGPEASPEASPQPNGLGLAVPPSAKSVSLVSLWLASWP